MQQSGNHIGSFYDNKWIWTQAVRGGCSVGYAFRFRILSLFLCRPHCIGPGPPAAAADQQIHEQNSNPSDHYSQFDFEQFGLIHFHILDRNRE